MKNIPCLDDQEWIRVIEGMIDVQEDSEENGVHLSKEAVISLVFHHLLRRSKQHVDQV